MATTFSGWSLWSVWTVLPLTIIIVQLSLASSPRHDEKSPVLLSRDPDTLVINPRPQQQQYEWTNGRMEQQQHLEQPTAQQQPGYWNRHLPSYLRWRARQQLEKPQQQTFTHQVPQGQVTTHQVLQGQVTTHQVSQGQVTTHQVPQGQVTTHQVSQGQVTTQQIFTHQVPEELTTTHQVPQELTTTHQVPQELMTTHQVPQGQVTTQQIFTHQVPQELTTTHQVPQGQVTTQKTFTHQEQEEEVTPGESCAQLPQYINSFKSEFSKDIIFDRKIGLSSTNIQQDVRGQPFQSLEEGKGRGDFPIPLFPSCPSSWVCYFDLHRVIGVDCSQRNLTFVPRLPSTVISVNLDSNPISNITCADFESLLSLRYLFLSYTEIELLPVCLFSNLTSLERLDLSHCRIHDLPVGIFDTTANLQFLDLSYNGLGLLQPFLFSRLNSLQYLNLYFNSLVSVKNCTFWGLKSLRFLSLQRNKLRYRHDTFDHGAFYGLDKLGLLHLQGNQVSLDQAMEYPDLAVGALTSLRRLAMDGVPVTPGVGFMGLSKLSDLDFSTNDHANPDSYCSFNHDIPEDFFIHFAGSREDLSLNLTACGLLSIPPALFQTLPNIFALYLGHNDFLTLDGFEAGSQGLAGSRLTHLDITSIYNIVFTQTEVRNTTFQYIKHTPLKSLVMRYNKIYRIHPQAILDLPKTLEYLCIRDNRIQYGRFLLTSLAMKSLQVLDGSNQLIYRAGAARRMSEQDRPNISAVQPPVVMNPIQVLTRHRHGDLTVNNTKYRNKKYTMTADSNNGHTESNKKLNSLDTFCPKLATQTRVPSEDFFFSSKGAILIFLPPKLETVYANNLKLGYALPHVIFANTLNKVLRHLEFSGNLATCWEGPIENVETIEYLDISINYCSRMRPSFFKYFTGLKTLLLQVNALGQSLSDDVEGIAFSTLLRLEFLDLSQNSLKSLSARAFDQNVRLRSLNLSRNELTTFVSDLRHILAMDFLDLSHNLLDGLSPEMINNLELQKYRNDNFTVYLQDNRFLCSCGNLPFLSFLATRSDIISRPNLLFCQIPGHKDKVFVPDLDRYILSLKRQCLGEQMFTYTIAVFFLFLTIEITAAILYHHRWRLRYLLQLVHSGTTCPSPDLRDKVLVIYDTEDILWRRFMQTTFLPCLDLRGIKYFLGEVNFQAGTEVTQSASAVFSVRKVIVLLSSGIFENNPELLCDINLAIVREMKTRSRVIIPVFVERFDVNAYPEEVVVFLQGQRSRCMWFRDTGPFWAHLVACVDDRDLHGLQR